jgi:hypothetical protein
MERRAFMNDASRVDRVFLASQDPDVLAFYEVESSEIFAGVTATFPGDTFQITEGEESQEILVGVRASKWDGRASQYDMRRLAKTHDASWSDGSGSSIPDSNLDHVYALNHLKFKNVHPPRSHQC